jgi:soluble lytic murein transglycosylase-like protein
VEKDLVSVSVATSTAPVVKKEETVKTETLAEKINLLSVKYGVDENLAKRIIYCESGNKPQAKRYNTNDTIDYSYWQINNYWWEKELAKKGWDIKIPEQNLEAGFYLLSNYGSKLWNWSKHCWD